MSSSLFVSLKIESATRCIWFSLHFARNSYSKNAFSPNTYPNSFMICAATRNEGGKGWAKCVWTCAMGLFLNILFVLQKYLSAHIKTKNHYVNDGFCVPRKGSGALRAEVSKTASCRLHFQGSAGTHGPTEVTPAKLPQIVRPMCVPHLTNNNIRATVNQQ